MKPPIFFPAQQAVLSGNRRIGHGHRIRRIAPQRGFPVG